MLSLVNRFVCRAARLGSGGTGSGGTRAIRKNPPSSSPTIICPQINHGLKERSCLFHTSRSVRGFEEFYDVVDTSKALVTGRGWKLPDLRRKVSKYFSLSSHCLHLIYSF